MSWEFSKVFKRWDKFPRTLWRIPWNQSSYFGFNHFSIEDRKIWASTYKIGESKIGDRTPGFWHRRSGHRSDRCQFVVSSSRFFPITATLQLFLIRYLRIFLQLFTCRILFVCAFLFLAVASFLFCVLLTQISLNSLSADLPLSALCISWQVYWIDLTTLTVNYK